MAIPTREALAGYLGSIENGQAFGGLQGDRGVGTFGGSEDHTAILLSERDRLAWYRYRPVTRLGAVSLPADLTFVVGVSGVTGRQDRRRARALQPRGHARDGAGGEWRQKTGREDLDAGGRASPAVLTRSTASGTSPRPAFRCWASSRCSSAWSTSSLRMACWCPRRSRRCSPEASTISDASRTSRNARRNSCSGTRCQRRAPWCDSRGGTARLPPRPSAQDSAAASGRSCRSSTRLDSRRRGEQLTPRSTRTPRQPRRSSRRVRGLALCSLEPFGSGDWEKPAWRVEGIATPRGTRRRAPVPTDMTDWRG